MSLRDEINSAPRGTKAKLVTETRLNKLTIIRATAGTQCCAATAMKIARAFGVPERWPELVVVRSSDTHQPSSLDEEKAS